MNFVSQPQLLLRGYSNRLSARCTRTKPHPQYVYACGPMSNGKLRHGMAKDTLVLASLIVKEGMNPLLGDIRTFLVYETLEGRVVGCGSIRGNELASLVVAPEHRRQGIASAIVKELLSENDDRDLFLLTLNIRTPFYERFGFRVCDDSEISAGMRFEKAIGNRVAPLVVPGSSCVAMKRVATE